MEDAFLEEGALSVVMLYALSKVCPILLSILVEGSDTYVPRLISGIKIADLPVATISIGVNGAIEVDTALKPIPLVIVIRVLEAHQLVDLRSACSNLDPTHQLNKQGCILKFILSDIVG